MFFYGSKDGMNVVASLDELEATVKAIMDPASDEPARVDRWKDYSLIMADVMATGGTFHITIEGAGDWRGPLATTPEPYKSRIENALGFFAQLYSQQLDDATVDVVAT